MAKSLFPEEIYFSGSSFTLEEVISKVTYFHLQLHLLHWQTQSYSEHVALGSLYEFVQSFKDDVVEKLMGYTGTRPMNVKMLPLTSSSSTTVVDELCKWAYELYLWAGKNDYCDVENMAQELSGQGAKSKYLLTLS